MNLRNELIIQIMGIKDKVRPSWLSFFATVTVMLLTFAIAFGAYKNQVQSNTKDINRHEMKFDIYYENQMQLIEDVGEIKGYMKGIHDGREED